MTLHLIEEASSYFLSLGLDETEDFDPTIQDLSGLISYIVATSNEPPKELNDLYNEIVPVMEGLTNVVTGSVLKRAGTDDKKKHDPKIWQEPMNQMAKAFCGPLSIETQTYTKEIVGTKIATEFINLLLAATVSQGPALAGFTKFLQSQGESIRLEVGQEGDGYHYASVSIIHEMFQAPDQRWIYVPKFKSYFTRFTRENYVVTSTCASATKFKFNFKLEIMTAGFMVENWKNFPSFRKQVRDFIERFQKTNIADSANYFDDIFTSTR